MQGGKGTGVPAFKVPRSLYRMVLGEGHRLRSQAVPLPPNPWGLHFLSPHSGQPTSESGGKNEIMHEGR